MTFRILHAADLHLDTPFRGLDRGAPDAVRAAVREAPLAALEALVGAALEREVDLVLLAGDVYDGLERGPRAQLALCRAAQRLSDAGVTTCVVHGNHDPVTDGWTAVERWPERFHVFPTEVAAVEIRARDGTPVTVHGTSYARREVTENLAARFPRPTSPGFHVALLHANVGGRPDHAPYAPCALDDLRRSGHDYWALGHVHAREILCAEPLVAYPGNPCGRSFRETGPKGALVVEVTGGRASPSFVALDPVRFLRIEVDVAGARDLAELAAAAAARGEALRAEHAGRALCVRLALSGRGALAERLLTDPAAGDALLADLEDRHAGLEPFLWWAGLDLCARPALDLEALRGGDDLAATLIEVADGLAADADARRAAAAELLAALPARLRPELDEDLVRAALFDALVRIHAEPTPR